MAQPVVVFTAAKGNLGAALIDLNYSASWKMALLDNALGTALTETVAAPRFGAGGSTDYSGDDVAVGSSSYVAGGIVMTSSASPLTFWEVSGANWIWGSSFESKTITSGAAAGITRYAFWYFDDANDYALAYMDLGQDVDLSVSDLTIDLATPANILSLA
jgi:hypothetical protein